MPKVILTGVAGVGKTTLARYLAVSSESSIYIPEDYRHLFKVSPDDSREQIATKLREQTIDWLSMRLKSWFDIQGVFHGPGTDGQPSSVPRPAFGCC